MAKGTKRDKDFMETTATQFGELAEVFATIAKQMIDAGRKEIIIPWNQTQVTSLDAFIEKIPFIKGAVKTELFAEKQKRKSHGEKVLARREARQRKEAEQRGDKVVHVGRPRKNAT